MYNAEKLRLDILKAKHKNVQEAFMGSYDRFRHVQRKVLKMQTELMAEKELKEAEKQQALCEADTLATEAASHEADKEMEKVVELLKYMLDKMGEELEMVKRTL